MKNSKKNLNSAGQSTTEVKRSQKHDANLQKNSTLYFQIGLILCLLGTYSLFEMQFQDKKIMPDSVTIDEVATIDVAPDYRVEVVQKRQEPIKRSATLIDKYKEVIDDTPDLEQEIFTPDAPKPTTEPVKVDDIQTVDVPVDPPLVDFIKVEKVPVYPGCERKKTNDDKRKCMSQKISKLVSKKFNTDVASEHGITGLQKITTQFTVDKNGNITNIKIRGPHPALEREANRVINKIPSMKPGYQQDKPVGVIYNLPIKFMVRD
ncbi:energy transducer TonB [Winogradskyella sp.]|jgi:protein TonB|uniref:energy transducer TonB n=1 Tax=Winogradskyella sp. TaxID=1883156 RepID=UPI0025F6AC70|nr:energy transducer TonB [Winogradskyella sp.]MCT4629006.1 energy transducer TonB [Winogradskyella sp.]